MAEFIGARISLISKRDIRYVGTLHQISSEDATVALEQVVSYGTEGRRPDDEVPPSLDNVYEYIVFRGSDVKDLRIEEPPNKTEKPLPPKVPDDPAILGSTRKQTPSGSSSTRGSGHAQPQQNAQQQQQQQQNGPSDNQPNPNHQQHQYAPQVQNHSFPFYPLPNQRYGPQGFPPGPGFPGMYGGGPPGWYPPPTYNDNSFPHMPPGPFPTSQMPIGPPGQGRNHISGSQAPPGVLGQHAPADKVPSKSVDISGATSKQSNQADPPIPIQEAPSAPPLQAPAETKSNTATALTPSNTPSVVESKKTTPGGNKGSRIIPAVPRAGAPGKTTSSANGESKLQVNPFVGAAALNTTKNTDDANQDARAAVAAAMAKLPAAQAQMKPADASAVENLTRKVNEMRATDNTRGFRGGRGRGGRGSARKVEVPKADYDFESANAKFNKHDLAKEAMASGSPLGTPSLEETAGGDGNEATVNNGHKGSETVIIPAAAGYNKKASFFDDISSEIKDRAEAQDGQKLGGREFRNEERQKNMETFGQGSVDNSFRYGRGRGRGRGRGFRGRGGRGRGRGGLVDA